MKVLAILLFLGLLASFSEAMMVCYYGSWAVYRPGDGKFNVEDLDPAICTHAIFGFAGLGYDYKLRVLDPYNELCENYGKCAYDRFCKLKELNPKLKTLLAVGGWNEGSTKYSKMAADPALRKIFIDSSIERLKLHGFDGLDMDWEYPTQRGGAPEDRANYVIFMTELHTALHAEGMILTAAVSAGEPTIEAAYDIPALADVIDILNLMAYDFHGAWDTFTHHQTPLYQYPSDVGTDYESFNVDHAVNYWISHGYPKEKIALGMGLYGRCWTLNQPEEHGMLAPANNPGGAGPYTRSPGFLGYNEICESMVSSSDWNVVMDPDLHEPYAYNLNLNKLWCGFDDHDSMITKANYAREKGLGGCMVWSIETDDFRGKCGREFDLIKTIHETFIDGELTAPPPPTTTTRDPNISTVPTTPTTTTPPVPTPPPSEHCSHNGNNPDPLDCSIFYQCINAGDHWIEYVATCGAGMLYNPLTNICDREEAVCAVGDICPANCS